MGTATRVVHTTTRTATSVPRARAAASVRRTLGVLGASGRDIELSVGTARLVVSDRALSPHLDHPAARHLGTLHGHVVDTARRTIAPAAVELRIDGGVLVLDATTTAADALPALSTAVDLLADELGAWADVLAVLGA